MGELTALGKRCTHYGKDSCHLYNLGLSSSCHCVFWEASAEYIEQLEKEAVLRATPSNT